MPTPDHDSLPDVAVGRHPDYGIVAANPKQLAASTWMLKGFDFHPVPDYPTLYALADQQRDGQGRATRAVALLRKAGYQVDVDAAFDPSLASGATPARDRPPRIEPDVALAEHPQLGIVAATSDHSSALGGRLILEEHGWRHNPNLDIYTLPITIDRGEALGKVANATLSMHRSDLQVAVQPLLAQDVAARAPLHRRRPRATSAIRASRPTSSPSAPPRSPPAQPAPAFRARRRFPLPPLSLRRPGRSTRASRSPRRARSLRRRQTAQHRGSSPGGRCQTRSKGGALFAVHRDDGPPWPRTLCATTQLEDQVWSELLAAAARSVPSRGRSRGYGRRRSP